MQDKKAVSEQEPTQSSDMFIYAKSKPRSARLFPVDYTQEEFSAMMNRDKRSVKKNLLLHPYISETLFDLLFSDSTLQNDSVSTIEKQIRQHGIPPIPVETVPFLASFYEQILSPEYRSAFSPGKLPATPEQSENFLRSFALSLYERIKSDPAHEYCRHVMFADSVFSETLLSSLWSDELNRRFDTLRNIARQTDPSKQAEVLTNLFRYIDQAIYTLANEPICNINNKDAETAIRDQLKSLLASRKKSGDPSLLAEYKVDNLTLDGTSDLNDAFTHLDDPYYPNSDQLRSQARDAYLRAISTKVPFPDFERDYQSLESYLEFSHELATKYGTRELVEMHCVETTRRHVKDYFHMTDVQVPVQAESHPSKYIGSLIDDTIIQHISAMLTYFGDTAFLVRSLSAMQNFISEANRTLSSDRFRIMASLINQDIPGMETYPDCVTSRILPWLNNAWNFIYKTPVPDFDPNTYQFTDCTPAAELLWKDGQSAAEFFNFTHVLPRCADEIKDALQICQTDMTNFTQYDLLPEITKKCQQLVFLVFLLILRRVVNDTVPVLFTRIKRMIAAYPQ